MKKVNLKNGAIIAGVVLMLSGTFISCSKTNREMSFGVYNSVNTSSLKKMESVASEPSLVSDSVDYRKFIRTGYLGFEVSSLSGVEAVVYDYAKKFGGYVSDSSQGTESCSFTVKIPVSEFENAITFSDGFGKLLSKSIYADDVTDRFYDLETRVASKQVMKDKLEGYLKKAKDMKELLEVEKQLNEVISDLEVMQGQFERLSKQIEYATLNLSFSLPGTQVSPGFSWNSLGKSFKGIFSGFGIFLGYCGLGLLYIFVFGVPLLAILAFLYWLLFGKIGLLVKLFSKLRK